MHQMAKGEGGVILNPPVIILFGDDEKIILQVQSTTNPNETYMVTWDWDNSWLCTCSGCLRGGHLCKHILAAEEYMKKMNMALLDDMTVFKGVQVNGR